MGIIFENTSAKYGKFLVVAFLIVIISQVSTAQRKIDCRKFVFAPPCRGIAAKRDTHSHTNTNDIRSRSTVEDTADYLYDGQKISNDNFPSVNGLLETLLKRVMSKNVDYDGSSNYIA